MSDKKIFIALSQVEARSIMTAIRFATVGCSSHVNDSLQFNHESAAVIGITAEELTCLWEFSDRLKDLADEQISLEAAITRDIGAPGTPERNEFDKQIEKEIGNHE